jgi:type II secretory pathway component PulM
MDGKLANTAVALALITLLLPSAWMQIEALEKIGVCVTATLLFGVIRYFDLKKPAGEGELDKVKQEIAELKEKVGLLTIRIGRMQ